MPGQRIYNFHDARLSLVQSCIREVICKGIQGGTGPGLWADHPVLGAASVVLDGIDKGKIADAPSATLAYDVARAAQAIGTSGTVGPADDCLHLLGKYLVAWALHDQTVMDEIRDEFVDSQCDIGWLTALTAWLAYYWDDKAPQYHPPQDGGPAPFDLPAPASGDVLRVGIIGDWGTGQSDAIDVLNQVMAQKPDVILHVGDIYYAGTPDECCSNFLDLINDARGATARPLQIPVFTLPGNHDYYSGGEGFYGMIPRLNAGINGGQWVQNNSFFCLRNDSWQLQGMDTGYNDHDLPEVGDDTTSLRDDEAAWHDAQVASAGGRRVILLSHHQLFSAFAAIGASHQDPTNPSHFINPSLLANLTAWQAKAQIVAWLWGHEHLLEVYAAPGADGSGPQVLGRCVGYGAFPIFNNEGAYTPKQGGAALADAPSFPNGYVQTGDDGMIYDHGYALMELGTDTATITYYQVTYPTSPTDPVSQALWTDTIPPSPAATASK